MVVSGKEPDSFGNVFQWAFRRVRHHLVSVVGALIFFPVVGGIVGAFVQASSVCQRTGHLVLCPPSVGGRLEQAALAAGLTLGGVLVFGFLYAVVLAPYEQRKALRTLVVQQDKEQTVEDTVGILTGLFGLGNMFLRSLERAADDIAGFHDYPFEEPTDERLVSLFERESKIREQLRDWRTDTEKAVKTRLGTPTMLLFRNHVATNRQRPPDSLATDKLWTDVAGSLQWLAQWIEKHNIEGPT